MTSPTSFCPNCGTARRESLPFCESCTYQFADDRPRRSIRLAPGTLVAIGGGLVIAIGSFLPWLTASTVVGSLSRTGIDGGGDGWATLVAGSVIVVLGVVTLRDLSRWANVLIALAAVITFAIFVINFADAQSRIAQLEANAGGVVQGGVGIGLWLVGAGAIVALVGSLLRRWWSRTAA